MRVAGEQESETDADLVKVNPTENRQRKVFWHLRAKKVAPFSDRRAMHI
jgi:hypothetical protein